MAKQLFLSNFTTTFIAAVKDAPSTGSPATELDYGVLRISDGAAGSLINPTGGDFYVLTAYKRSGATESNIEVMVVTGVNNATPGECRITVLRAQEGTTTQAYVSGDYLSLRLTKGGAARFSQPDDLATKEPLITEGANSHYWRGDKTWRDFGAGVRTAALTGLTMAASAAIAATDTVLDALAKLQAQLGGKVDKVSGKGLSTEDYTTAEKTKLAGLSDTRPVSNLAVTYVNGQATAVTEDGVTKSISYNAQGRVATVSYPYAGKTRTETYTYNTNGQMTGMTASDAL